MFFRKQWARSSFVTIATLSCMAFATESMGGTPDGGAALSAKRDVIEADGASSVDLVSRVVGKWEATLTQAYGWQQEGVEQLRTRVSALPVETLRQMAGAQTWKRFTELMIDAERLNAAPIMAQQGFALDERDPDVAQMMQASSKVLGDQARDLTFIPIKPCRVFDTRFDTLGSPTTGRFTSATTKNFWVFNSSLPGDFATWGGNNGCAETAQNNTSALAGTAPYAVMIKLTIVGPAAPGSYVSAVRSGDTNPAPNLVSAYCEIAGGAPCFATVVVPVCRGTTGCTGTRDISVQSNMALDLAGEVMGYFVAPQATPLQCVDVTGPSVSVAPNTYAYLGTTACTAGYTPVSGSFAAGSNVLMADHGSTGTGWYLYVRNVGASTQNPAPRVTCCRIPGR